MGDNKRPILSVLVDEDKKTKFANLAREHNYSMGWLLNQAIDKMLAADTIHIYRDSIEPIDKTDSPPTDIEALVKSYVDSAIEKAIAPISIDLAELLGQVDELRGSLDGAKATGTKPKAATTKENPHSDGRLEFGAFADEHRLDIERGDSAGDIRSALDAAGLSGRYQYNSTVRAFYEY
jgi:hypothetical protein